MLGEELNSASACRVATDRLRQWRCDCLLHYSNVPDLCYPLQCSLHSRCVCCGNDLASDVACSDAAMVVVAVAVAAVAVAVAVSAVAVACACTSEHSTVAQHRYYKLLLVN
jgi:hypothetical protein